MERLDPFAVPLADTALIEASAGTGKTYTITTLYLRLLLETPPSRHDRPLRVGEILVVTFTNAATAELRRRIRRRIREALAALEAEISSGDETLDALVERRRAAGAAAADRQRLLVALREFDEAAIFTIHGFCRRMLGENAFESGAPFEAETLQDQTALVQDVVSDFWLRELRNMPPELVRHLRKAAKIEVKDAVKALPRVIAYGDVPIKPDRGEADLDGALGAWREALGRARGIWRAEKESIVSMLCESRLLDHRKYRKTNVAAWARNVGEALASPLGAWPVEAGSFERFGTAALRGGARGGQPPEHAFFEACDVVCRAHSELEAALAVRAVQFKHDLIAYARRELARRKDAAQAQSFDDLLHRLAGALAAPGGEALAARIRGRYAAVLIDEFQDTDAVQYEIFRRIYHGSGPLFLIGDPKQAIYAFRGADVFAYRSAKLDAAGAVRTLLVNRRSDPGLIEAVNTLFAGAPAPFVFDWIPFEPASAPKGKGGSLGPGRPAPLEVLFVPRDGRASSRDKLINSGWADRHLPELIAAEVARALDGGLTIEGRKVSAGDIAVLCRKNSEAINTQRALQALGIPTVLQSEQSVFATGEAEEVERVVRAMAEPWDAGALRAAMATGIVGVSANDLTALQRDEAGWDAWARRFEAWRALWLRRGFASAFRRMYEEQNVGPRLLAERNGERRVTDILHVGELLQQAAAGGKHGPAAVVDWLARMRRDEEAAAALGRDAAQMRLESDASAVRLVTVHKSKGLEYPVVFCPFLWGRAGLGEEDLSWMRFHDEGNHHRLTLDVGVLKDAESQRQAEREALAEALRLLYVALTRAKHRCSIVWGAFRGAEESALGYVLHRLGADGGSGLDPAKALRFKALDDDGIVAELRALEAEAGGAVAVRPLLLEPFGSREPDVETGVLQACPRPARTLDTAWRLSSFSGLLAEGARAAVRPDDGADRDAVPPPAAPDEEPAGAVLLNDFPSGIRAGTLIHEIFERLDFRADDPEQLRKQVAAALRRHGFEDRWEEPLAAAAARVLRTPLAAEVPGLMLANVPRAKRLCEMEFVFPVGAAGEGAGGGRATAAQLAGVFAGHAAAPWGNEYASRLRALEFTPLAGFLRGFVDLVFEHEGRWYLVDYKSNHLGPLPSDYDPERLVAPMIEHHYVLQYHLYVVALHKFLRSRLADYDYERHFGGVYYLFVRGMGEGRGGIFSDRPRPALIEALEAAFAAARSEGAA